MDEMYPTFENATLEFQAFLAQQAWPPQVFWIRPEDARLRRRRINVRSMSRDVEALAAAHLERTKAGARHVLNVPAVRELSADPRLISIASQFVGSTPIAFRATLFDKSPKANWLVVWHQDTALPLEHRVDGAGWGPWSTKA